jgi:hypothetical protein
MRAPCSLSVCVSSVMFETYQNSSLSVGLCSQNIGQCTGSRKLVILSVTEHGTECSGNNFLNNRYKVRILNTNSRDDRINVNAYILRLKI